MYKIPDGVGEIITHKVGPPEIACFFCLVDFVMSGRAAIPFEEGIGTDIPKIKSPGFLLILFAKDCDIPSHILRAILRPILWE